MTDPTLVLGAGAAALRRRLGPVSWVALATLVASASEHDDGLVVTASVRDLDLGLGLARNTAARAVRRLIDTGLLTVAQRRDTRGAFGASIYRLSLPLDAIGLGSRDVVARVNVARSRSRVSSPPSLVVEQLALLPE